MFGFFKKNDEQEKALAAKSQLELKTLVDEIATLKEELRGSHELIELRAAFHTPRAQELEAEKGVLSSQLQKLQSEKEHLQERFNALEKDRQEVVENRQLLWEEYQKLDALRGTFDPGLGDRANQLQAEKDELEERFSALQKDRSEIVEARQFLWEEYQKLEVSRDGWQERFTKLEQEFNDARAQGISSLVSAGASFDGQNIDAEKILEQARKLKIQIESLDQENNFLLIQIRQNQDELEKLSLENRVNKDLNHSLNAKWHRLEKRFPNYIDYGGLEVISVDGVATIPKIIWKITDYSKAGLVLPEFYFQTILQNGQAGISIIDGSDQNAANHPLVPELLTQSQEQREVFIEYGLTEWNKISAACDVLEQLIVNNGAGLGRTEGFDLSFWRSSLATLVSSIQKLPKILRFDRIRLKRELVNPNYEHLWLEFYDVQLDNYRLPKFEMRLAAALVESNGFSRFPKIEIPLVNGKDKPFESWYPESHDDQGAKLELRFALDKQAFDLGVFAKLGPADQRLIQSFVYRLPAILNRLAMSKVSIHRQWQDWFGFAQATALVMQNQLKQAREIKEADATKTVQTSAKDEAPVKKSISVVSVAKKGSASKGSLKNTSAVKKKTVSRSAK
jgi:FtsZ-binding cell division protein ZapB